MIFVFVTFVVDSMALQNGNLYIPFWSFLIIRTYILIEICGLPHSQDDEGITRCLALNRSWSYISRKNICVEFDYGGCGGNDNNFTTKEECESKCLE